MEDRATLVKVTNIKADWHALSDGEAVWAIANGEAMVEALIMENKCGEIFLKFCVIPTFF
ncbi:hypothetical protein DPMN_100068 [Dreissena polymorpha]|uniref:Uncharacterized protein n=1 Tax=Dreissena polymorpha TaxID=45954 RepID=A0A9D4R710_DREPO|nr:hypothetical protein DPMN_100068 [Dreissena polymorpha]